MKSVKFIFFIIFFQVLHQDIESHSQLIKTVLLQCAQLAEKHKKKYKNRERSAASHKRISILLSVGKIIEKRWHCLWLRSLEWQCFLEQFTSCSQKVRHEGKHFDEFSFFITRICKCRAARKICFI